MPKSTATPIATDAAVHHKSCTEGRACHEDCKAWKPPSRATHSEVVYYEDRRAVPDDRGHEVRGAPLGHLHGESAPPLWERLDPAGLEWLRCWGVSWPHPDDYHSYGRSHPCLDRWTADDGEKARELDRLRSTAEKKRRSEILQTNDDKKAAVVALWIRESFPGIDAIGASADVDGGFMAGCYAGIVWGFALCMFGLDHDPLPEHVSGRILPGAPLRDTRAPFRDARAVFAIGGQDGSGASLGAGGTVWPEFAPENGRSKRMRSQWGECYVRGTTHSTTRIAGEAAVHVGLSAVLARRRAKLTETEEQIATVMLDEGSREDRVLRLREVRLRAMGGEPSALVTAETRRLRGLRAAMFGPDGLAVNDVRLAEQQPIDDKIAARASIDRDAYPSLLREATKDVTDRELLREGRAVVAKLGDAVYRESVVGDALAAPRKAPKPRRRVQVTQNEAASA